MGSDFFSNSMREEVWTLETAHQPEEETNDYFALPATNQFEGLQDQEHQGHDFLVGQCPDLRPAEPAAMHYSGETSNALQTTSGVGSVDGGSSL